MLIYELVSRKGIQRDCGCLEVWIIVCFLQLTVNFSFQMYSGPMAVVFALVTASAFSVVEGKRFQRRQRVVCTIF